MTASCYSNFCKKKWTLKSIYLLWSIKRTFHLIIWRDGAYHIWSNICHWNWIKSNTNNWCKMHERVTFLCVRMYSILNIPSPPHDRTYHNSVGVFVIHVNRGSLYMIFQSGKNPKTKKGESLLRSTLYHLSHTIYQSYQPRSLGWRILLSLNRVVGWLLFFMASHF